MGLLPPNLRPEFETMRADLAAEVLRNIVKDGWSLLDMAAGMADALPDTTGLSALGGATHDVTGKYLHNPGTITYGANVAGGKTVIAAGALSSAANMIDGNTGTIGYAQPVNGTGWVGLDLGAAMAIRKMRLYQAGGYCPTVGARYSDNGTDWTDVTLTSGGAGAANAWATDLILPDVGSHRYWAFKQGAAVTGGDGVWWYAAEMEMYVGTTNAAPNVAVRSISFVPDAPVTLVRLVALWQPVDSCTLGTDCLMVASADGGGSYVNVPLADLGKYDSTTRIIGGVAAVVAGSAVRWGWTTANAKNQRLRGVVAQWR